MLSSVTPLPDRDTLIDTAHVPERSQTVAAHVALALSHHIDYIFGVMGNGNAYFLDALERLGTVQYTAVRHESGAVVAADAYHRASGRLAAATTTYGAGFTNTLTALAEAVQARIPLILVVGDEPTSGPRPWDVDQIALASAVGARTYTVGRTDCAATTIIAVEHALTYRVPTVLALPYDTATTDAGEMEATPTLTLPRPLRATDDVTLHAIDETAAALARAQRPLLLAGRGAWIAGAKDALGTLAELTGALTSSTALGRGIFPDDEFDLGVTGGFGALEAMRLIHSSDVAVIFGASLNQFTMRFGNLFAPETHIIQIDTATTATHAHVGRYIRGDARIVAEMLVERVREWPRPIAPWRRRVDVAAARVYDAGEGIAADGRLDPRSAAQRLGELLPDDRVVVTDGGHFMSWANMYWSVAAPDRMLMVGTAYQSIGLGFPSVVGATRAKPRSCVVLSSGDGGGLMALADLESAIRVAGGRGIAVIWNDAAYGAEINMYGVKGLTRDPMRIPEADFAALGRALGADGVVVRTLADLDVVSEWVTRPANDRPFLLLDLRISGRVISPHQAEINRASWAV